jgi:oligopeptidase A
MIFQAVRAVSGRSIAPKQTLSRPLILNPARSIATQVSENPFLNWQLFPDFETLLTQCKPATAIPIFEKFLDTAEERFKQLETNFTPTWDGSIGLGTLNCAI